MTFSWQWFQGWCRLLRCPSVACRQPPAPPQTYTIRARNTLEATVALPDALPKSTTRITLQQGGTDASHNACQERLEPNIKPGPRLPGRTIAWSGRRQWPATVHAGCGGVGRHVAQGVLSSRKERENGQKRGSVGVILEPLCSSFFSAGHVCSF